MSEVQIAGISPRHVAIADFLVANPQMKKSEIAAKFGVTPAWLSVIIHSDAFQALLRQKQNEAFSFLIAPIADKLNHIAHQALDRLSESVAVMERGELFEAARFSIDRINYEGKPADKSSGNVINVNVHTASAALLEQARARIARKGVTIDGEVTNTTSEANNPATPQLLAGGAS